MNTVGRSVSQFSGAKENATLNTSDPTSPVFIVSSSQGRGYVDTALKEPFIALLIRQISEEVIERSHLNWFKAFSFKLEHLTD